MIILLSEDRLTKQTAVQTQYIGKYAVSYDPAVFSVFLLHKYRIKNSFHDQDQQFISQKDYQITPSLRAVRFVSAP